LVTVKGQNLFMAGFVWYFFPETSGLSLESVDLLFTTSGITDGGGKDVGYQGWRQAVKRSVEMHKDARRAGHRDELENLGGLTHKVEVTQSEVLKRE
jgi:hypothetical protein